MKQMGESNCFRIFAPVISISHEMCKTTNKNKLVSVSKKSEEVHGEEVTLGHPINNIYQLLFILPICMFVQSRLLFSSDIIISNKFIQP